MRAALLVALALGACGANEPGTPTPPDGAGADSAADGPSPDSPPPLDCAGSVPASGPRYLPLAVGATWTYHVLDLSTAAEADKTSTVEDLEDVGDRKAGTCAYRVRTEKLTGTTVSWQQDTGQAVVRHHEKAFDTLDRLRDEEWYEPSKLRLDEAPARLLLDAQWQEVYEETHLDPLGNETVDTRTIDWTVEALDEEITVPAGTFTCIRVRHTGTLVGQSDKQFWFALGVGKVRELGGQLEELTTYSLP